MRRGKCHASIGENKTTKYVMPQSAHPLLSLRGTIVTKQSRQINCQLRGTIVTKQSRQINCHP